MQSESGVSTIKNRAPFQILAFLFCCNENGKIEYAIFRRTDAGYWQGLAGGGNRGETPLEAAKRECWEEGGIPDTCRYIALDSISTVPVVAVVGKFLWGNDVYVIPEYAFGVEVDNKQLKLSGEHTDYKWTDYEEAIRMLKWDSNKNALWELNQQLLKLDKGI